MRSSRPFFLLCCLAVLPLCAQTNTPPPPDPSGGGHGPMAQLTGEERARVKAAHDKALASDPSLKKTMDDARRVMEEARKAMHEAMIKADPSIEPLLAKMGPPKPFRGDANTMQEHGEGRKDGPPGMAGLTPAEREKIRKVHDQAANDPSVVSAREVLSKATTPGAREEADKSLRKASFDAMIKLDPSLGPILEKLQAEGHFR